MVPYRPKGKIFRVLRKTGQSGGAWLRCSVKWVTKAGDGPELGKVVEPVVT